MDSIPGCTLAAQELAERLAWVRAEILPHACRTERLYGGVAWELADAPGLREKLDRLIELERACCSTIDFSRTVGETPGTLRLEIRGVDPDADVFRSIGTRGGS